LAKLITFMVRQAHHERNQHHIVRPELVEGHNQRVIIIFRFSPCLCASVVKFLSIKAQRRLKAANGIRHQSCKLYSRVIFQIRPDDLYADWQTV
jgi:hypothetical protein